MKKSLGTFLFLVLLLLFAACTSPDGGIRPNLPYRVWESWGEMKEVLGDHYLYPTYLPEATERSEHVFLGSGYNSINRELDAEELFFGYYAFYHSNDRDDSISIRATDYGRWNDEFVPRSPGTLESSGYFNKHTVTIGGIDIQFSSHYSTFIPPDISLDEWNIYHPRNARMVYYSFEIGTVTYFMHWTQFNVEDKYADDEQREGMLRVAKSIIEQVREVE